MNGEEFFDAINMIDDELVDEAAVIKKTKRKNKKAFFTLAACLTVFICLGVILSKFGVLPPNDILVEEYQDVGTIGEIAENTSDDNLEMQDSTLGEITGSTPPQETVDGNYSTPPQEAVTVEEYVNSPPEAAEPTTVKTQCLNENGITFKARIIEVNNNSVSVEPLDSIAVNSADRIVFSTAELEELDVKKGDVVNIVFDGVIMETYPVQINVSSWSFAE